jgi:hypothetical protein
LVFKFIKHFKIDAKQNPDSVTVEAEGFPSKVAPRKFVLYLIDRTQKKVKTADYSRNAQLRNPG